MQWRKDEYAMNRNRDYEMQCLLELLSAAVNKETRPEWPRYPNWGDLYRLADYHHVANAVYGMIIGIDDPKLMRWKGNFEERFHYCVVMHEKYREEESLILKSMEKAGVHCLYLEEKVIYGCYAKKEHHYPMPLGFLVEPGKADRIADAMQKIGFVPKQKDDDEGENGKHHFHKPTGVDAIFYERIPFTSRKASKYFSMPPQPFRKQKGCKFIHVQDIDDFYIYYIATLAEKYARGNLELRDVMDLWQYYQLCYEQMEWKVINKELKRLEIDIFGDLIVKLAATWFGNFEGFDEDSIILMSMERYIISKGADEREENEKILPLVKEVADIRQRNLKKEKRRRTMEMLFPERAYMEAIYPVLSKTAVLLPFCWVARLISRQTRKVKYFFGRIGNRMKARRMKIREKFRETHQKIKKRFAKRKEDEDNA